MTDARVWRRIAVAAAVSGALHAAVIALAPPAMDDAAADLPPLAVRIESAAPPAIPTVVHPPREVPKSSRAPAPRVMPSRASTAPPNPARVEPEEPLVEDVAAAPDASAAPPPEPAVIATAPASSPTESPATASASTSIPGVDTPALPAFPRSGRIAYTLVYGRDQFPVGRTVQSWKIDGTRYQLASRSETTGIVDLIRSQHRTYLSRGELTPEGLRPDTFLMSRNRGRGVEEARATFKWAQGMVTLGPATSPREEPLPSGSQDLVSFMYQLAIDPPAPGQKEVVLTNGTRIETHVLNVLPEEKIDTPLGVLRALPVTQVRKPGRETVDVWLATEYRYLPVRLRFYGRDGEPMGEQVVTEIRLTDE